MPTMFDVLLGLGSNLGDRRETLLVAWRKLDAQPEIETVQISRLIETQAVGGPADQPNYLNAVGLIRTTLTPQRLLDVLHGIECRFGRARTERWGPRTLDLDILLFGDLIVKTETLTIPHPEMLRRDFVMQPAVEIAPDFWHPDINLTLRDHRSRLSTMEIRPFAAYRYNTDKITSLSEVVAPPYDVIDDAMQDALYAKHPNNVVRLILDKMHPTDDAGNNRYTRTAKTLAEWKENGVIVQDEKPAIYVYHQVFETEGKAFTRKGFMCRCRAVPFGYGMVYPHEITMSGPKLDRLMLTTACKMNFSQIFGLYPDEENAVQRILEDAVVASGTPPLEATDHLGVVHRMWVVDDPVAVAAATKAMEPKPIFIADGHHRYETACNYRLQVGDMGILTENHPANYVLMVCIAMEDPGLIVMPTHRLFPGLAELSINTLQMKLGDCFTTEIVGHDPNDAHNVWTLIEAANRQDAIGLYAAKDKTWLLTKITEAGKARMSEVASDHHPEWRELGVSLLHRLIVETLLGQPDHPKPTYVHLVSEVVTELQNGDYPLAALVMPATVGHIKSLSLLGDRMPAKSTYFYPKLIAGFVFNPLE